MKLRLLLLAECNRTCKGCCNKEYDLNALPVCQSYAGYSEIMITGGEPMLRPDVVAKTVKQIRAQTNAPIFLYTAWRGGHIPLLGALELVDGITLTLHTRKDVAPFVFFNQALLLSGIRPKSLRLNVFRGITVDPADALGWSIKKNIVWIKDLHLPADEVFMRTLNI